MQSKLIPLSTFNELENKTAGYDVLRYIGLTNILGNEKNSLLYFFGRDLCRSIEITSLDDVYFLFNKLSIGQLSLVKEKKHQMTFQLMSDDVAARLLSPLDVEFRLEAGFLAEAIEIITNRECECVETINKKIYTVEFKIIFTD